MASGIKDFVAPIIAALLVIFVAVVTTWLFFHLDMQQPAWERAIYLLNGLESVGFAAAGYLFGKEVNRQRAEKAEARGDEAVKEAAKATSSATAGKALAHVVQAKLATQVPGAPAAARYRAESAAEDAQLDLRELGVLAQKVLDD